MAKKYNFFKIFSLGLVFFFKPSVQAKQCDNFYPADRPMYAADFRGRQQIRRTTNSLKFVSYNINVPKDLNQIFSDLTQIAELKDADFIVLQEVNGSIGKHENAAQLLAMKLKMAYAYSPNMVLWGQDYGNAVLSRWPIDQLKKVYLPLSEKEDCNLRSAFTVRAATPLGSIQVGSVHLSVTFSDTIFGGDKSRSLQLEPALAALAVNSQAPSYIAGDLNTVNPWGTKSVLEVANKYSFANVQLQDGWTNRQHKFQLDRAFGRGPWVVEKSGIAQNAMGSDHVPIWSILKLK